MLLDLVAIPNVRGVYGPSKNVMPARALFLAPDAAASLAELEAATGGLVYSDIWRSAEASLAARVSGKPAQRPAYSGHNFGLSLDVDVEGTRRERGWTYSQVCAEMARFDWYCHRRDGLRGSEDWHFNYLGGVAAGVCSDLSLANDHDHVTWSRPVESAIQRRYGKQFVLSSVEQQAALRKLGLYKGAIDGELGPLSKAARAAFERAWLCTGEEKQYQRTLAFVSADVRGAH